jgi:hypothetical protein
VAQISAARAELELPAFAYDSLLARVGEAHCAIIIGEGGEGHFSRAGVPSQLRHRLVGGTGFHLARHGHDRELVPVAASATLVTRQERSPPSLRSSRGWE